jgi:DNA-directed RNA polymerase subunit alpha
VSAAQNKQPRPESAVSRRLHLLAGAAGPYKVEPPVEQRTDFDKLILDVETKPSMRPRDAVASAGKTLVELFGWPAS